MKFITGTKDIQLECSAVALGKFDGLHKGHQLLIEKIKMYKAQGMRAVMFTFDFHPKALFSGKTPELIFTREERKNWAEKMGVDVLIEYPFNQEVASMEPEVFIEEILKKQLDAKAIVCGEDFKFGHNRRGDVALLKKVGSQYGFIVDACQKLQVEVATIEDGQSKKQMQDISSSLIRDAIRRGDMEFAADLLGAPYSVSGTVVHGKKIGRTIGMPTANLVPDKVKIMPPNGVYSSKTIVGPYEYHSVTNIGVNPTIADNNAKRVETYVYDFDANLYGENIEVQLFKFQRAEMKFENLEHLKNQIYKDKVSTMEYFFNEDVF